MFRLFFLLILLSVNVVNGQISEKELIGEWNGRITSELNGGRDNSTTLILNADGSFTETSSYLSSIYPQTQKWKFIDSSKHIEFSWVNTYYAGKAFYSGAKYKIAQFSNDSLVLFYDRDDLEEPLPHVSTFRLSNNNKASLIDFNKDPKHVIKTVDLMGREIDAVNQNTIIIELLNDGTSRKVLRTNR